MDVGVGFLAERFDVGVGFFDVGVSFLAERFDVGVGFLAERFDAGVGFFDVGLGGEVAVEEADLFVGQCFGLLFGKAVLGEVFDKFVGVKVDGFAGTHKHIKKNFAAKACQCQGFWVAMGLVMFLGQERRGEDFCFLFLEKWG